MRRKKFIQYVAGLTVTGAMASACTVRRTKKFPGALIEGNMRLGHALRDQQFGKTTEGVAEEMPIVIIGAGISGLSAAYHLQQAGYTEFIVLDLESTPGGNAVAGKNSLSAYPWGAHYIPIPNPGLPEYMAFLEQAGVIDRYEQGKPVYNELYLCFDPEERLYINGKWQDGLVPDFGLPEEDRRQVRQFMQMMQAFRDARDHHGIEAFAIPLARSSTDKTWRELDNISILSWLQQQGFSSKYLVDYINYCTRDDYGTAAKDCSAWAAIHYFASRKGVAVNADHSDVLTWPEGNQFLATKLIASFQEKIKTNCLVTEVNLVGDKLSVSYLHQPTNRWHSLIAHQCVLAVPQMIAARLLKNQRRTDLQTKYYHYAPWLIANLRISKPAERTGSVMSWDNVPYGAPSLGYVDATHQFINSALLEKNITYYHPLTDQEPQAARLAAYQKNYETWVEQIVADLKRVHPDIEDCIKEINVKLWGHAMPQPRPGFLFAKERLQMQASIAGRIHPAHSDLAGISIFEEAFYQGYNASQKIIQALRNSKA